MTNGHSRISGNHILVKQRYKPGEAYLVSDRAKVVQTLANLIQNAKGAKNGDEVIIQTIIAMAQNLNLEVLAEGVETQEQLKFLKREECNQVQGFYFSKPVSSTELENILRNPEEIRTEAKKLLRKELPE